MKNGYWRKLHQTILDSSIWAASPETKIVWVTLILMADRNGIVQAAVPGVAHRAMVPLDKCVEAIKILTDKDAWSRSDEGDGGRLVKVDGGWRITNWDSYQQGVPDDREQRKRDQARERMRRYREKQSEALDGERNVTRNRYANVTHVTTERERERTTKLLKGVQEVLPETRVTRAPVCAKVTPRVKPEVEAGDENLEPGPTQEPADLGPRKPQDKPETSRDTSTRVLQTKPVLGQDGGFTGGNASADLAFTWAKQVEELTGQPQLKPGGKEFAAAKRLLSVATKEQILSTARRAYLAAVTGGDKTRFWVITDLSDLASKWARLAGFLASGNGFRVPDVPAAPKPIPTGKPSVSSRAILAPAWREDVGGF